MSFLFKRMSRCALILAMTVIVSSSSMLTPGSLMAQSMLLPPASPSITQMRIAFWDLPPTWSQRIDLKMEVCGDEAHITGSFVAQHQTFVLDHYGTIRWMFDYEDGPGALVDFEVGNETITILFWSSQVAGIGTRTDGFHWGICIYQ